MRSAGADLRFVYKVTVMGHGWQCELLCYTIALSGRTSTHAVILVHNTNKVLCCHLWPTALMEKGSSANMQSVGNNFYTAETTRITHLLIRALRLLTRNRQYGAPGRMMRSSLTCYRPHNRSGGAAGPGRSPCSPPPRQQLPAHRSGSVRGAAGQLGII